MNDLNEYTGICGCKVGKCKNKISTRTNRFAMCCTFIYLYIQIIKRKIINPKVVKTQTYL